MTEEMGPIVPDGQGRWEGLGWGMGIEFGVARGIELGRRERERMGWCGGLEVEVEMGMWVWYEGEG